MKSGHELDVLVTEKVMGLEVYPSQFHLDLKVIRLVPPGLDYYFEEQIPNFSTDIAAAGKVLEKLAKDGWQIRISNKAQGNDYWWIYLDKGEYPADIIVQGSTIPEAICLAAIKTFP